MAYAVITVVMTWPVAARISRDLPHDLGDPAFVTGVMAWGAEHWLALLGGNLQAASDFWNAPIFYPEPLTLAYSEHFALHSLLTLPVYAITRNPVLCYNLAFLSTFFIAALAMYLFVREITSPTVTADLAALGRRTGFAGGTVDSLSSPPAGARQPPSAVPRITRTFNAAAFVAGLAFAFAPYRISALPHLQVLSSQWMPLVLLGLHRYITRGNSNGLLIAGAALWAQNMSSGYYMIFFGPFVALYALAELAVTGAWRRAIAWRDLAITAAASLAATLPFALPYVERMRGTRRAASEIAMYSADLDAWLTASPLMTVWGHLQTLPSAEGSLFPGITVVVLALLGVGFGWRIARGAVIFGAVALALSFWLALGIEVRLHTHAIDFPSLYQWLLPLPGFNAARVPARFATVTVLALALLAGIALGRCNDGRRRWVAAVCGALILVEGAAFPLPMNGTWTSAPGAIIPPPARLSRLTEAPAAFKYLAQLPPSVAIVHFPFGLPEREIQYGYYAMLHGRRIVNGYSGGFPPTYNVRAGVLSNPFADVPMVRTILDLDRVTHAIVHTGAYTRGRGMAVVELLEKIGWTRTAQFEDDYVLTR